MSEDQPPPTAGPRSGTGNHRIVRRNGYRECLDCAYKEPLWEPNDYINGTSGKRLLVAAIVLGLLVLITGAYKVAL